MMKPFFLTLLVSLSIFWISEGVDLKFPNFEKPDISLDLGHHYNDVECENINPKESSLIAFGECPLCGGGTITIKYYDFILRLFLKCTKKCIDITCTPGCENTLMNQMQHTIINNTKCSKTCGVGTHLVTYKTTNSELICEEMCCCKPCTGDGQQVPPANKCQEVPQIPPGERLSVCPSD